MSTPATPRRYHHGELRSALVAAALDQLEHGGPASLSLRGLARVAGVSPMAPYHHFPDRAALLAAVAVAGFERLQSRKLDAHAPGTSPADAMVAGTASYVAFVLAYPNLYRLMNGPELGDRERYPELKRAAAAPAGLLLATIAELFDGHGRIAADPRDCARMLWGLAHGIGTLALDGQIDVADADRIARAGARSMIEGWLHESGR